MAKAMTVYYALVGNDADFLYYRTPSCTTTGKVYDLTVDKRKGRVECNCKWGRCWHICGDLLDPQSPGVCRHIRLYLQTVGMIVAKALTAPRGARRGQ